MIINQRNLYYVLAYLFSIPTHGLANVSPWQGPYAGVYIGGGFGNNHISTKAGSATITSYFTTSNDIDSVNNAGTWRKKPNTMNIGIRTGYDLNWKQIVYGATLDYSSLTLKSSDVTNNIYPSSSDQYSIYTSMSTSWLFTLRGRLGYQKTLKFPSLFYLTGGAAVTELKVRNSFNDNSSLAGLGGNKLLQNQIGWTVGAGIDIAVFNSASLNIEYLFIKIPSVKTISSIYNTQGGFGIPIQSMTSPLSTTANFYANTFKIGLNYSFA